jgi:hypothetical protein
MMYAGRGACAHSGEDGKRKEYLRKRKIDVLNWPPNCPDLNPIENFWGIVKAKMKVQLNFNVQDLKAEIQRVWDSLPKRQVDEVEMSYPRRVQKILRSGGGGLPAATPFKKKLDFFVSVLCICLG